MTKQTKCAKITSCEEHDNLVYEAKGCKDGEIFSSLRSNSESCSKDGYVKVEYDASNCGGKDGKFCQADSIENVLDFAYVQSDCWT